MNLKYELPEKQAVLLKSEPGSGKVLYCIPVDLDDKGMFQKGWFVVTNHFIFKIEKKCLTAKIEINKGNDFKVEKNTGCGMLTGEFDGRSIMLARFTMSSIVRFSYIARALNEIVKGSDTVIVSTEEEYRCKKCGIKLPEGRYYCRNCIDSKAMFIRMLQYAKESRSVYIFLFTLFLLTTGSTVISPYLQRILIDNYLVPQVADLTGILIIVAGLLCARIFNMLASIVRTRTITKVGNNIVAGLRQKVYERMQYLSLSFVSRKKAGHLMNVVSGDTNEVSRFLVQFLTEGVTQVITLTVILIILFLYNWKMAILVLVPTPLVFFGARIQWDHLRPLLKKSRVFRDKANSYLQDILNGIRVVKAFGKEERAVDRFRNESANFRNISIITERMWNTFSGALFFLTYLGSFLVMYFGGKLVLDNLMKPGELVQFMQYTAMIYGPMRFLTFLPRRIGNAAIGLERIFNIIDMEPEIKESEEAVNVEMKGNIKYSDVTFGYQSHEMVLEGINIHIEPGEMIGLVGHSGAGKSTFINLLMRLYDVDEGRITIDGVDIRNISHESLKKQIGVVLQETFLFSGSILENIRYAKPDAGYDEVIRAAKIANAHEFIMGFPDGYDTLVGEKGQRLSGGERQRISIARAILNDPKILILDEATSSLDTETEQKIQQALGRLIRNRTTIAIAHRLSTLKNAQRLMVIEKGKRAELGSHEELMKMEGIYYSMVKVQNRLH